MTSELLFLTILIILGFLSLLWYFSKKLEAFTNQPQDTTLLEWAKSTGKDLRDLQTVVSQSLQNSSQNLNASLQKSSTSLNQRLDKATEVIGALQKEAGEFASVSRSMKELDEFLRSPKLRGNLGEQVLKDLIAQIFPPQRFDLQYSFKSGAKVDVVIKTGGGLLPIDSKFPLENFQKMLKTQDKLASSKLKKTFQSDVKKHIRAISEKYILPNEGTMDFALMYLPSEAVYYELANQVVITEYAKRLRVYPVSPSTLYSHLQMILLSFEGKKIEKRSKEIFTLLRAIQGDYKKVEDKLSTLGGHLGKAYNKFSEVDHAYTLIGQKLESTQSIAPNEPKKLT